MGGGGGVPSSIQLCSLSKVTRVGGGGGGLIKFTKKGRCFKIHVRRIGAQKAIIPKKELIIIRCVLYKVQCV